jgi:hypothetical protein
MSCNKTVEVLKKQFESEEIIDRFLDDEKLPVLTKDQSNILDIQWSKPLPDNQELFVKYQTRKQM